MIVRLLCRSAAGLLSAGLAIGGFVHVIQSDHGYSGGLGRSAPVHIVADHPDTGNTCPAF